MIAVVILGILVTLGVNKYVSMVEHARVVQAIGDIKAISYSVHDSWMIHRVYQDNLAEVGENDRLDPWGRAYEYIPIDGVGRGARKDKNLVPINTDFDLYSVGADGASAPALTAKVSRDDVVRAANGGFIGLAENY